MFPEDVTLDGGRQLANDPVGPSTSQRSGSISNADQSFFPVSSNAIHNTKLNDPDHFLY